MASKKIMMACGHVENARWASRDGVQFNPPIPSCVICDCIQPAKVEYDLSGRLARCSSCDRVLTSSTGLAFFEFRGEGSPRSREICGNCGYAEIAHNSEEMKKRNYRIPVSVVEQGKCPGFKPHGPYEFDAFYCGCRGWD